MRARTTRRSSSSRDFSTRPEAIEQPREIGIVTHHALGDGPGRKAGGTGAAQDAEHVELRRREPARLQGLRDPPGPDLRRALDLEEDLLLERTKGLGLTKLGLQVSLHERESSRYEEYCQ